MWLVSIVTDVEYDDNSTGKIIIRFKHGLQCVNMGYVLDHEYNELL